MSGFQKKPGVSIKKPVYSMATQDGTNAEITLYGDIYENPLKASLSRWMNFWRI